MIMLVGQSQARKESEGGKNKLKRELMQVGTEETVHGLPGYLYSRRHDREPFLKMIWRE